MRKKWFLRSSILFSVILVGFGGYLLTLKPTTLSTQSNNPKSAPNEGSPPTTADTGKAAILRPGGESPKEGATESLADAEASRDFSGVTTINPDSSSPAPTPQKPPEQKRASAPLPLVFQPVDSLALKITPEQQAIIDRLQQNFLDEIGGANQDPNDPAYRERWEQAQPYIDEQLKAQLGQQTFVQYQLSAIHQPAR